MFKKKAEKHLLWEDYITPDTQLQQTLKTLPYKIAVSSNWFEDKSIAILTKLGIIDCIDVVYSPPSLNGRLKPSKEAFEELFICVKADMQIASNKQIIYLDYQYNNIHQAMRLGATGVIVNHKLNKNLSTESLNTCHVHLQNIHDVTDIPAQLHSHENLTNFIRLGEVIIGDEHTEGSSDILFGNFDQPDSDKKDFSNNAANQQIGQQLYVPPHTREKHLFMQNSLNEAHLSQNVMKQHKQSTDMDRETLLKKCIRSADGHIVSVDLKQHKIIELEIQQNLT